MYVHRLLDACIIQPLNSISPHMIYYFNPNECVCRPHGMPYLFMGSSALIPHLPVSFEGQVTF